MLHLISIIGGGPGDPELLTVKAQKRLQEADYVLYDALIGDEILKIANTDAIKIYVGKLYKDGQDQIQRQNEIHNKILSLAEGNNKIIRLKAGDSMVFGRGAEEIRFCEENDLNYEVIPGITAGLAASSLFGIPVTERGKNSMCLFYTAHRKDGSFSDLDAVIEVLKSNSSVIVYMGINNLPEFSESLIQGGIHEALSVQIISNISQIGQKALTTTLGDVVPFLEQQKPETPAIVIMGKHAIRITQ